MKISPLPLVVLVAAAYVPHMASGAQVTLGKSQDSAVLDTSTAQSCGPTLVEQFTRRMLHQAPADQGTAYYLITQRFVVGTGCFRRGRETPIKRDGRSKASDYLKAQAATLHGIRLEFAAAAEVCGG